MSKPRKALLGISFFFFKISAAVILITFCFERYLYMREMLPPDKSLFYCYCAGFVVGGISYMATLMNLLIPDKAKTSQSGRRAKQDQVFVVKMSMPGLKL